MISQKVKNTSVIAAIAIASIALLVALSQTHTTTAQTAPTGNNVYVFAEGVSPQATFMFREATVTYDFQIFSTTNNLLNTVNNGVARGTSPEFTLIRIVGDTPYLHKAVDQTFEYGGRAAVIDYPYKLFDVSVDMMEAGQSLRTFKYGDCSLTNYKINTRTDNEEGYTTGGKTGFAVTEEYYFSCNGLTQISHDYDQAVKQVYKKGNVKASQ
jgi:hypothetical protein